jgi:2-iminobutanoate/2-iminopropanoate deaminase
VTKVKVNSDDAPAPAHTFSQGVIKNGILQVSGQGPVDPTTNEYLFPGDVGAQTTRAMRNVEAILKAGGAELRDVVMLRVYLTSRDHFGPMNEAYGAFLDEHLGPDDVQPCRTTVIVGLPRADMLVEIDAMAVVGD